MIDVAITPSRLTAGRVETLQVQLVNTTAKPCFHIHLCLKLPAPLVLLNSPAEIDIPRLEPGEDVTRMLRLKARKEGTFQLTSSAFSYRNGFGQAVHPQPFSMRVDVLQELREPSLNAPPPVLKAGIVTDHLTMSSWTLLEGWIENAGTVPVHDVELRIHLEGGEASKSIEAWRRSELLPGQREAFLVPVLAREKGIHVPVRLIVVYRDAAGKAASFAAPGMRVQVDDGPPAANNEPDTVRILLAAAEPADAPRILTTEEFGRIQEELRLGPDRERFKLHLSLGTRITDLSRDLLQFRPRIVHFSGHGSRDGLHFLNENGRGRQVRPEGVAHLFQEFSSYLQCVVLNACYSEPQADEIKQFIPYVIGMKDTIASDSAIAFSRGFYQAIAAGSNIEKAFNLGCIAIENLGCDGSETPVLKRRD